MADNIFSIDDFSPVAVGPTHGDDVSGFPEEATPPETAPPPPVEPARRSSPYPESRYSDELLPPSVRAAKGERYKNRGKRPNAPIMSIDDFGPPGEVTGQPASTYNPNDDYAWTRGFKGASESGTESIATVGEVARMLTLSEDEQRKAMLAWGKRAKDPGRVQLQEPDLRGADSFGEIMTWLGESAGGMAGSMWAAAKTGGLTGGLAGGALGAAGVGTATGGLGAPLGAVGGALAGAGYGTMAAFGAMGIGGMYDDLLSDPGVQKGIADGTVSPSAVLALAGGGGAVIGALDAFPVSRLGGKVFGELSEEAVKTTLRKALLKGAATSALEEGGTEGLQGAISEFGQAVMGGDVNLAERAWSVINQAAAGAVGGGGPGAAAGAYENARIPDPVIGPQIPAGGLPQTYEYDYDTGTTRLVPRRGQANPAVPAGQNAPAAPVQPAPVAAGGNLASTPIQPAGRADQHTEDDYEKEEPGEFKQAAPAGLGRPNPAAATTTGGADTDLVLKGVGAGAPAAQPASTSQPAAGTVGVADATLNAALKPNATAQNVNEGAAQVPQEEGGIRPWQEEFGPDPRQALLRMGPDDPRIDEVREWVKAQQAALDPQVAAARVAADRAAKPPAPPANRMTTGEGIPSPYEGMGAGIGGLQIQPQEQVDEQPVGQIGEGLQQVGRPEPIEHPVDAWEQPSFQEQIAEAEQGLAPSGVVGPEDTVESLSAEFPDYADTIQKAAASGVHPAAMRPALERTRTEQPAAAVVEVAPVAVVTAEVAEEPKRPVKGLKGRLAKLTGFAKGVRQAVAKGEQARLLYEAAEEPVPTEEEVLAQKHGTSYKEKAPVPTPGQAEKRKRAAAKYKAAVAHYKKLREDRASLMPVARRAMADAVEKYNSLKTPEEREHFIDQLGEYIGEELFKTIAAQTATKEAPTSPVEAIPAARLPAKTPTPKRAPAASAAQLKPKPQAKESKAKPKVEKKRLRVTPALTAKMRAAHLVEAQPVAAVSAPEFIDYKLSDAAMLPAFRATNARLATMSDAELRDNSAFKNNRDPAHQIALKYALKEMGVVIPQARKGISKEAAAKERTHKTLVGMLAKARERGQAVVVRTPKALRQIGIVTKVSDDGTVTFGKGKLPGVKKIGPHVPKSMDIDELFDTLVLDIEDVEQVTELPPVQIRKSVRERAIEAMREHFAGSEEPVKLSKVLGFSPQEVARLESAGMAVDGTMDKAEFERWRQSEKGATVPEGIGPEAKGIPPAKASKYARYTVADLEKLLPEEEIDYRRWQRQQEAKAKAPFKREVKPFTAKTAEVVLKSKAKRAKAIGVVTEEGAELVKGKAKTIPVVSKTAKNVVPLKRAIEPKAPTEQGVHVIKEEKKGEARELTRKELEDLRESQKGRPTAILEQELQRLLPKALKDAGVDVELSQTQLEEAAASGARAVSDIFETLKAPLHAAVEGINKALEEATAAYKRGEEAAINAFFKKQNALHAERNKVWAAEAKARAEAKAKVSRTSPVTGEKASQAIAREDNERTRIIARNERKKAPAEQDPILIEIARLWDLILAPGAKEKSKKTQTDMLRLGVKRLQAQRIAIAVARDAATEIALARHEQAKQEQADTMQQHLAEWLVRGIATQADIEQYQFDQEAAQQFDEKAKRGAETTPIIHQSLVDHPRPKGRPGWDIWSNPREDQELMIKIMGWAEPWAKATRKALRDAGLKVNEKISKKWNTPEENALIFVESLLRSKWYQSRKKDVHRGMSLVEAYNAVGFIEPVPKDDRTDAEVRHERWLNEQALDGIITDASKSSGTQHDPWGQKQMEQASYAGRFLRTAPEDRRSDDWMEAIEDTSSDTDMAAAFKRAMNEKGLFSEHEYKQQTQEEISAEWQVYQDRRSLKRDADTMSASEAMARYLKGWQSRPGVQLTGWRRQMRRALIKSLRSLVGDTPVHFVRPEVMLAYSKGGLEPMGMYERNKAKGKPFILLNETLKGRPGLLDEVLLHELVHAATAHAIDHNVRGARDNIRKLMNALEKQLEGYGLHGSVEYAFKNEHEFLAQGQNSAVVQQLMSEFKVPFKVRAQMRAFSLGRAEPSFWDAFVSFVQNAIGMFVPGRAGISYMDEILRIHPHVAMSSSEQMADREIRVKPEDFKDLNFGPFDLAGHGKAVQGRVKTWLSSAGRGTLNKYVTMTNEIRRRVADNVFGGSFKTAFNDLVDELETLQRRIEIAMNEGDKIDDEMRRWMLEDPAGRRDIVGEAHDLVVNMSIDGVDARKTLKENHWIRNDADHPLKGGRKRKIPTWKHMRDTGKRAAHARYKARWDALPAELKPLLSDRLDHMKAMMLDYETAMVTGFLNRLLDNKNSAYILPPGMSRPDAVKEIMDDNMSDELEKALGMHAKTIGAMGKFGMRDGVYAPASRMGNHFISGRRKIEAPTPTRGTAVFDDVAHDDNGVFRYAFNDLQDAVDYVNKMGASGDERVLKFQRKYINPRTSEFVESKWHYIDASKGIDVTAQPVYFVTMQDRFMAMSDSVDELLAMKKDLMASGEYEYVDEPIELREHRSISSTMPLQLQAMINNINSQQGIDEHDRANAIDMITNHFIRTQQGNRITKRMIKRTGVEGFETGADEMFRSFHTNNEMMARHRVALDRTPAIAEANRKIDLFIEALKSGRPETMTQLSPEERAIIHREYGKGDKRDPLAAERLVQDQKEINRRIEGTRRNSKIAGEQLLNAVQSITTLNYLAKPIYMAIQTTGLPVFTYPNMVAEISKLDGYSSVTRAMRYMQKGFADVGLAKTLWRGVTESAMEGRQLAEGLKPRQEWTKEGRVMRRSHDYISELEDRLTANGANYLSVKIKALRLAYMRQAIGQAGLDQPNLRMDLQQKGLKNKFYRGVEQSTRVFRAMQEGIETVNRAVPLFAYVEYYMDKGFDEDQAVELAVSNMSKEQVNYAKTNWANFLSHPVAGTIFMFKKFAAQAGYSYWQSVTRAIGAEDKATQRAAILHLATSGVILGALGGFAGNPLWEPIRYLMYLLGWTVGWNKTWDETKTAGEKWLGDATNPMLAETAMYGLPRLMGFDISNRMALDSILFYRQPEDMTKDDWTQLIGELALGATGALGLDALGAIPGIADPDKSWPKWAADLPLPGSAKDILKVADSMIYGPRTTTGVSTGEPPGILGALVQSMGIKTRDQARPFEQGSAAQHKAQQRIDTEKAALIRQVNSGGLTGANMRRINAWNAAHPEKDNRINAKSLSNARKRKGKTEQEIAQQNLGAL